MPAKSLPSRAFEYRIRAGETRARAKATPNATTQETLLRDAQTSIGCAEECRVKAEAMSQEEERRSMMETADTWERMARWEDETNPSPPAPRST